MNKIWTLAIALCLSMAVHAQNDAVSTLFQSYANDDSFTKVSISSKMFQLFTHIEGDDKEEKEVLEAIAGLSGMKILSKNDISNGRDLYKKAVKSSSSRYEELMSVKDGDEDLTFFIREKSGKIEELLMLTGGENSFMILSLFGDIDLNKVAQLSRSLSIGEMDQLQKLEENK
jgi:hypothetical protein